MQTTTARPERKDVVRNRARLLAAADQLISEQGVDLSLNAVAKQAGVGVGTVYRHFADRDEVIGALLTQRVDRVIEVITAHLEDEDPVAALRTVVLEVCAMQADDKGTWQLLTASHNPSQYEAIRSQLLPLTEVLVRRARATGRVRPDLQATDVPMMLWLGGALTAYAGETAPGVWRRYITVLLDGFSAASGDEELPVPALTANQVDEVMQSAATHPRG